MAIAIQKKLVQTKTKNSNGGEKEKQNVYLVNSLNWKQNEKKKKKNNDIYRLTICFA